MSSIGICINDENSYGISRGKEYELKEPNNECLSSYYEVLNDYKSIAFYKKSRFILRAE